MLIGLVCAGWTAAAIASWRALALRRQRAVVDEALAVVAHEIRGPLAAARLGIHPPSPDVPLSPARRQAVELELARAGLALDDLLALRRRAAGPRRAPAPGERLLALSTPTRFDLRELAAESVEGWSAFASSRQVRMELLAGRLPLPVQADRTRLAQVSGNLLANAIEHGGGRVLIRCRPDHQRVRLEVEDDGPGLPAPVEELIKRSSHGARGRGLGIAAAVAAAHGGRLAAAPAPRGARLVLELPAADAAGSSRG